MALGLDDNIYCSAFLSVASLDHLLDRPVEYTRPFDIPDPQPVCEDQIDALRAYNTLHGAVDGLPPRQRLARFSHSTTV